MNIKTLA